jgi:hypothetical protein
MAYATVQITHDSSLEHETENYIADAVMYEQARKDAKKAS